MNKIVFFAVLFFIAIAATSTQAQQLCYNPNGDYYYDCTTPNQAQRTAGSSNRINGNNSTVNTVSVVTGNNSTVVINNQAGATTANRRGSSGSRTQLCYNPSGGYYYDCARTQPVYGNVTYPAYYPNRSYPTQQANSGYVPVTPTGSPYGYPYYQPVYGTSGGYYQTQPRPTPYWHDQRSTSVTHDIQTNVGNSNWWWGGGGFNPRNVNVNYRVRIQQNRTSVRGSSVNGQVPYVYNTGTFGWP